MLNKIDFTSNLTPAIFVIFMGKLNHELLLNSNNLSPFKILQINVSISFLKKFKSEDLIL